MSHWWDGSIPEWDGSIPERGRPTPNWDGSIPIWESSNSFTSLLLRWIHLNMRWIHPWMRWIQLKMRWIHLKVALEKCFWTTRHYETTFLNRKVLEKCFLRKGLVVKLGGFQLLEKHIIYKKTHIVCRSLGLGKLCCLREQNSLVTCRTGWKLSKIFITHGLLADKSKM